MRNLKTAAVLKIAVMVWPGTACSDVKSPTRPGPTSLTAHQSTQANGADNAALAAVREATAAFHDVDKAVAAGCVSPVGGRPERTAGTFRAWDSPSFAGLKRAEK